jgi:GH18 family chitinase
MKCIHRSNVLVSDARLELFAMARRGGVKLILLLGGFDAFMTAEDFTEWTKNAKNRENFLTEVLGVVDKFNLQGVLFQWYYPGCPRVRRFKVLF